MKIKRRQFLAQTTLGLGATLVGAPLFSRAEDAKPKFFDPFEPVPLGKTKLKFSRVVLGTGMKGWSRQSNQARLGKEKLEALIRDSFDRGVRGFDLADLYGTHPYVIPALKGIQRDRFQVISKIWWNKGGIPEPERPDADVVVERFGADAEYQCEFVDAIPQEPSGKYRFCISKVPVTI